MDNKNKIIKSTGTATENLIMKCSDLNSFSSWDSANSFSHQLSEYEVRSQKEN